MRQYEFFILIAIFLIICYSTNIILSSIQISNKESYGYNGILSMLDDNQLLLEMNKKDCDKYYSDIKYKIKFSGIKTLLILLYNIYVLLYCIIKIKGTEDGYEKNNNCLIDIFLFIIMYIGYFGELVLVSLSLTYYNKTDYDSDNFEKCNKLNGSYYISKEIFDEAIDSSKWVINIDKGIISVICILFFLFFGQSLMILCCISLSYDKCIDEKFCWICKGLGVCLCAFWECFSKCCGCFCDCCSDCCKSMCHCCSDCCKSMCHCCSDCCKSVCDSCSNCCKSMCDCSSNCCSDCFGKCGQCCATCCGNDFDSLKRENNKLRNRIKELEKENDILKRQNPNSNNITTERKKLANEIITVNDANIRNTIQKKLPSNENNDLRNKIIMYQNKLDEIKEDNNILTEELKKLKDGVPKNIEENYMKVIEFYLRKEKTKEFNNYKSSLKKFLLKEIKEKFGLYLDSDNFKKITLYYIKSRLSVHLINTKNLKMLSDPVITNAGITVDRMSINQNSAFVENKLVLKIIEILNKNKDLQMTDFIIIKNLLKNPKTNNYYNNPVVISSGNSKGETIEGDNLDNKNYKNLVIKNIINELKEFFEDDIFKFKGLEVDDMKNFVDYNNIMVINFVSGDGIINQGIKCLKTETFAEVEEKLYKLYEKYRSTNNIFLHGGNTILRFKTIEENNIRDNDKVQLQLYE